MSSLFEELVVRVWGAYPPFFGHVYFGNTITEYAVALIVLCVFYILFWALQGAVLMQLHAWSKKTATNIDDTIIDIVRSVRPAFYLYLAFYIAVFPLTLPEAGRTVLTGLLIVWIAVRVVLSIQKLIDFVLERRAKAEEDEGSEAAFHCLAVIAKWALWVLAILVVLGNFGIDVTSVLAGLGIAGIAVGLALQNILADLFSSFAIYFDKPFQAGDFIVVGEHAGTVEYIGIKTTRIRALQGEEIVISNRELTSARVQNFRRLEERRIAFHIGILYETPAEKVKRVPELVEKIFEDVENVRLDRVHFSSLGDSALTFEIVYFVLSREYNDYMDAQQSINVKLFEACTKEKIGFAYPTQTVHVAK